MDFPIKNDIPYNQIDNGALILLLIRESSTWEELCARYAYADPEQLKTNTTTMVLRDKLLAMRELGLIGFDDEEVEGGKRPVGEIKDTGLWTKIRVAFGGMSLSEVAMISSHSIGMAIAPVFGRPKPPKEAPDVFVMMPFRQDMLPIYDDHIRKACRKLNLTCKRADDLFGSNKIIDDVWELIAHSRILVADCTGRNPNVFYELGIAHTLGKRVVLIAQDEADIPFDIRHMRYIKYQYTPRGMIDFEKALANYLTEKTKQDGKSPQ
jgi:hypothetical protein